MVSLPIGIADAAGLHIRITKDDPEHALVIQDATHLAKDGDKIIDVILQLLLIADASTGIFSLQWPIGWRTDGHVYPFGLHFGEARSERRP